MRERRGGGRALLARFVLAVELATDEAVGWRALGVLFLTGGLLAAVTAPLGHIRGAHPSVVLVTGLLAVLTGLVLWRQASVLPVRLISLLLAFGTLLITLVVVASRQPDGRYSLLYVWVALEAYYFLDARTAMLHMLSVAASYAVALMLLGGGADQWILVLGTVLTSGWLVGALRARIQRLSDQAKTDPLTGLENRRGFDELIETALAGAREEQRRLSLILFDLDRFKSINDAHGHPIGDAVLRACADHCRRLPGVRAARLGGDEFALLAVVPDTAAGAELALRICQAVRATPVLGHVRVTISAGIASFPAHGASARALIQAADQALYHAKRSGRDQIAVYGPAIEQARRERVWGPEPPDSGQLDAVVLLSETLDLRDTSTTAHSQTVARYAEAIAAELGLAPERRERIRLAGIVHDLGKIGVPDHVLFKPGELDEGEWEMMRRHPELGARILEGAALHDLAGWVIAHHERPDGTGYPFGLRGEDIPLEARILAVADAYEAMTSHRPYRDAMPDEEATAELVRHRGSQFDAGVVDAMLAVLAAQGSESASGFAAARAAV